MQKLWPTGWWTRRFPGCVIRGLSVCIIQTVSSSCSETRCNFLCTQVFPIEKVGGPSLLKVAIWICMRSLKKQSVIRNESWTEDHRSTARFPYHHVITLPARFPYHHVITLPCASATILPCNCVLCFAIFSTEGACIWHRISPVIWQQEWRHLLTQSFL